MKEITIPIHNLIFGLMVTFTMGGIFVSVINTFA